MLKPSTLLFFFLLIANLSAQPNNFLSYSLAEGLAQSQVFALCQDTRGYLWCGTQGGGLSRFDGADFQTFNAGTGLPSDFIQTLFEDSKKRLWVGTNNGFGVGEQGQFFAGFKSNFAVNAICETAEGTIWLGTPSGILTCRNPTDSPQALSVPHLPSNLSVQTFLPHNSDVWVGTNRGVYRVGPKSILSLTTKEGLPSNSVTALAYDQNQHLWIATAGGGIVVFDEAGRKIIATYTQVLWPTCLQLDSNGKMWAGTSNQGIFIFDPQSQSWQQVAERHGLPHNHVRDLLLDQGGQMWISTSGGGIARALNQQFRHYTTANGLTGNRIYALHADQLGRIWLSAAQNGLQMLDSAGFHPVAQDSGLLAGVKCKALVSDRRGRIWVGTDGRGLFLLDSNGLRPIEGVSSLRIQSLVLAPTGEIWVASLDQGLFMLREDPVRPGSFFIKKLGVKDGLNSLEISTLKADGKGNVWFGTSTGILGYFESEKLIASFGSAQNGLPDLPIRTLTFDARGHLWVGFRGGGVWGVKSAALESNRATRFSPLEARLASQNVYLLLSDLSGHLWVGTEKGVDEISFESAETSLNQSIPAVLETRHYGYSEGFLGIETCQDAALSASDGSLWFGTMNGLTQYIPSQTRANHTAPVLHFQQITLFYKPLSETPYAAWLNPEGGLRQGLHLNWNENHLSFEFRAIDLSHPDGLRYRWKLEGVSSTGWSPFSNQRSVNFAGLQAGDYTFWIQAVSADGTLSEPEHTSFSIQKPFWQTLWFMLLVGLLLASLVFWGLKKRIRQVRKLALEKHEKLEVQHRLLQLEQKALQLQMNPHFIFNALNSVQSLMSSGDTAAARTELNAFAQLMRSILSNSRRQTLTLQEETETLSQYLQIEQFCRPGKPFDFSIHFAEGVDAESIELPPMLLQPFVENAVLHGLEHLKNRKGVIKISFAVDGETLRCTIEDNGVGREKAALLRGERQAGHSSAALDITRERLEALAENQIPRPLEFKDIRDLEGEIVGTQVVVVIPLRLRW